MKTFKEYTQFNEGDTTAAYDMEKVIVSAAGGPKFKSKLIKNSDKVGKKIITSLRLSGKGSFPKNSYPATKEWNTYFGPKGAKGSTLTPKTDLLVGKKRISLKTGDAQLMSGGPPEARATFYSAAKKSNTLKLKLIKDLGKHMDNLLPTTDLSKIGVKGSKTDLEKAGKFAEVEILKKADDAHQAFKKDLRDAFGKSPAFAQAFTFEAMTGETKFGNNTGTAEFFLVTDYEGNAKLHNAFKDKSYVKKIASQVKPDVKFKSTQNTSSQLKSPTNPKGKTGFYTFWSAVGVGVKMVVKEELEKGPMLNEGVFDFVKRIYDKAKNWLSNFWDKVKKMVGDTWESLLSFMALEPVIRFNNTIKW
jgi:hypothetical protein